MLLSRSNKYHLIAKLEADGFGTGCYYPTLLMMARVWDEMCKIMGYVGMSGFHPIWERVRMGELGKRQGFTGWYNRGILFLYQLYSNDHLKSFKDLQDDFGIPHSGFFRYLQLCQALSIQAGSTSLKQINTSLINQIANATDKKGLISLLYGSLVQCLHSTMQVHGKWDCSVDIPSLDGKIWQSILEQVPLSTFSYSTVVTTFCYSPVTQNPS